MSTGGSQGVCKVELRAPQREDSALLFRWINDRALVSLSAPFRVIGRMEHEAWFAGICQGTAATAFFMIDRVEDGLTIGSCRLNVHALHRSAELQIRIGVQDAQGNGCGSEAVRKLVSFGFETLGLHRVGLQVFATNLRAVRAYEKAGFEQEGRLREAACIDGRFVDILCMGILNGAR